MRIAHLRNFLTVVECGNITRAAERAHIAQTALGKQMRSLENEMQVELLNRGSQGAKPTEAGILFYERARGILRMLDETRRDVSILGGVPEERVSVGAPPSVVKLIGGDMINTVRQVLPSLRLALAEDVSSSLLRSLGAREIDFALAFDPEENESVQVTPVMDERILFVRPSSIQGSGLYLRQPIQLGDALAHKIAVMSYDDDLSVLVRKAADRVSRTLHATFEVRSIEIIKELISRGISSAFLPYGSIREEIQAGKFFARPVIEPELSRVLNIVRSRAAPTLSSEAEFVACLGRGVDILSDRIGPLAKRLPTSDHSAPS